MSLGRYEQQFLGLSITRPDSRVLQVLVSVDRISDMRHTSRGTRAGETYEHSPR